jgi:hypothetical protein
MPPLATIRRVTVYADQALQDALIENFRQLGAKGHTVTETRGVGQHPVIEDVFAASTHVRIELLVQPVVADGIMEYLAQPAFKGQPVVACVESVEVSNPEHF